MVPKNLENPHPVIAATLQRLKKQKPNSSGCFVCAGADVFRVSVSPAQLDRAMRILDTVVRACEEQGVSVQQGGKSACLESNGEKIDFSLTEQIDRRPHEQTPAEAARAAKERKQSPFLGDSRPWWQPQWDFSPSGRLCLELENQYFTGLRRLFRDGKRRRLEDSLNEFISATVQYAAAQKARREEQERRARERREEEKRRIERSQQVERNKERWKFLSERIQTLERAAKIDRFLEHLASNGADGSPPGENVRRLIEWARRYSGLLKSTCAAAELESALASKDLFKPPTVETDQWFAIV